jgi:CdiI immunity protein
MKSRSEFPALRDFLRGYFHEDCLEEYGSLAGAARQFVEDADVEQREVVAREWRQFLKSLGKSLEKINAALGEMGSACEFASLDEVKRVGAVVGAGTLK